MGVGGAGRRGEGRAQRGLRAAVFFYGDSVFIAFRDGRREAKSVDLSDATAVAFCLLARQTTYPLAGRQPEGMFTIAEERSMTQANTSATIAVHECSGPGDSLLGHAGPRPRLAVQAGIAHALKKISLFCVNAEMPSTPAKLKLKI